MQSDYNGRRMARPPAGMENCLFARKTKWLGAGGMSGGKGDGDEYWGCRHAVGGPIPTLAFAPHQTIVVLPNALRRNSATLDESVFPLHLSPPARPVAHLHAPRAVRVPCQRADP